MDETKSKKTTRWKRGNPFAGVLLAAGLAVLFCVVFFILPYYAMHDPAMRARILDATLHRFLPPEWDLRIGSVERFQLTAVQMRGVRLVHRTKGGEETFARLGSIDVGFDPAPLLAHELVLSHVRIDSLRVRADIPGPEFLGSGVGKGASDGGHGLAGARLPTIRIGSLSATAIEIARGDEVFARGDVSVGRVSQRGGRVHVEIVRLAGSYPRDSLEAAIDGGIVEGSLSDTVRLSEARLTAAGLLSRIEGSVHIPQGPDDVYHARVLWNIDRITPENLGALRSMRIPFATGDSLRGTVRIVGDPKDATADLILRGRIFDGPLDSLRAIANRKGSRITIEELTIDHRAGSLNADGAIGLDHPSVSARIRIRGLDLGDASFARWIPNAPRLRIDGYFNGTATLDRAHPEAEGFATIDSVGFKDHPFGPFRVAGRYANDEVTIDSLDVGNPSAGGRVVGRWSPKSGALEAEARLSGFSLQNWIGPFVRGIPFDGTVEGRLALTGSMHSPQVSGRLEGKDFRVVEVRIQHSIVDSIRGTLSPFDLHADAHAGGIRIYGFPADTADFHMDWDRTMRVGGFARVDSVRATTHVTITPMSPGFLTVDEFHLLPGSLPPWTIAAPGRIDWTPDDAVIAPVRFLSSDGTIDGELRVHIPTNELSAKATLHEGNLGTLQRLLGLPDSSLAGTCDLDGTLGGTSLAPSAEVRAKAHDLVIGRWPIGTLESRLALESGGTLRVDTLDAGAGGGRGRVHATGIAARIPVPMTTFTQFLKDSLGSYLRRTQLAGHVEVDSLSLSRIVKTGLGNGAGGGSPLLVEAVDPMTSRIFTTHPGEEEPAVSIQQGIGGEIHGRFDIGGTGAAPRARASCEIRGLRIYEARADSVFLSASLEPGSAILDSLVWHRRDRAFRAHGNLPIEVSLTPGKTRIDRDAPISLDAQLPEIDLALLGVLSRQILDPVGTLSGSLSLRGSINKPLPSGSLAIRDGGLRIPNREERLRRVNGELAIDSSGVHIEKLTGHDGGNGTIEVMGSFRDMDHFQLDAKVRDATVFETGLYHFTADGDFSAYPVVSTLGSYPLVVGTVEVRNGAIVGDLAKVPTPPPGAEGPRSPWHAEIDVHAPGNLRLQTAIASIDLGEGNLHVSFVDPDFNVSGGVTVLGGRYRVFNNVFNVTGGTVEFSDVGRQPEPTLDITAQTEVNEPGEPPTKVQITIHVTGPLSKLNLAFESQPSRSEDEIVSLLSLGRFQNQQTGTIGVGTLGNPGGQYLLTELASQMEAKITQLVSPLQNVSIQPGVAPNEPWKLNVRQNVLLPQISLGYSRDLVFAQSATQNVSLRYNLGGVFYLNADVQRGLSGLPQSTPTDTYSLDLKLRFEYK